MNPHQTNWHGIIIKKYDITRLWLLNRFIFSQDSVSTPKISICQTFRESIFVQSNSIQDLCSTKLETIFQTSKKSNTYIRFKTILLVIWPGEYSSSFPQWIGKVYYPWNHTLQHCVVEESNEQNGFYCNEVAHTIHPLETWSTNNIYVDGTNNPKIPVGEIHSTKTLSPKIQLDLPKSWTSAVPFVSFSRDCNNITPTVKLGQAKSLPPFQEQTIS